eukprot:148639_1
MMDTTSNKTLKSKKAEDRLTVHGFIRTVYDNTNENLFPDALVDLCFLFYHVEYVVLRFSTKYKREGVELTNDNKCLAEQPKSLDGYKWVLCDTEPVQSGRHCWRFYIVNPNALWFSTCVAQAHTQYTNNGTSAINCAYGVGTDPNWYPYTRASVKHEGKWNHPIGLEEYHVDMLFNADIGELQLCIVERKETYHAKIFGIPCDNERGYVPHFNTISLTKSRVQIASIPNEYFGKPIRNLFVDCSSDSVKVH